MNKKRNQHYLHTHGTIQQALKSLLETKELNRITVRQICDVAQINRSSFYVHYSSIQDLMGEVDALLKEDYIELFSAAGIALGDYLSTEGMKVTLDYIRRYKNFYKAYIHQLNGLDYIEQLFQEIWDAHLRQPFFDPVYSREDLRQAYLFHMGGATKIIESWLKNDCAQPLDEVAAVISRFVPKELKPATSPLSSSARSAVSSDPRS